MSEYNWQKLNMPCPKCAMDHKYEPEIWVHGDICRGLMMINSNGMVRCCKCGKTAHITNMQLSCDSNNHLYYSPSTKELAASLAIANGMANGSIRWFKRLLDNL